MPDVNRSGEFVDMETRLRQRQEEDDRRYRHLLHNAQAVFRTMEGWQKVQNEEDQLRVCREALAELRSGQFFLERLGAERYLDPKLFATLWQLRHELLAEGAAQTAADTMLVDLAVLAYHNALRAQGWMGDLALVIESELFGQDSPTVKVRRQYGRLEGLAVEDHIQRLTEQLMCLFDRANRMVIRNLKALRELRRGPTPAAVAIGHAAQVHVAQQQANTVVQS
jgi:hypothetical protein